MKSNDHVQERRNYRSPGKQMSWRAGFRVTMHNLAKHSERQEQLLWFGLQRYKTSSYRSGAERLCCELGVPGRGPDPNDMQATISHRRTTQVHACLGANSQKLRPILKRLPDLNTGEFYSFRLLHPVFFFNSPWCLSLLSKAFGLLNGEH